MKSGINIIFPLLLSFIFATQSYTQIEYKGTMQLGNLIDANEIPVYSFDKPTPKSSSNNGARAKSLQYAVNKEVSISPLTGGIWKAGENGSKYWWVAINCSGVSSLGVIFEPFTIAKGVKVFVSDKKKNIVKGAFIYRNNWSENILAVGAIKGETVIVEMQVPGYVDNFGAFEISEISCGILTKQKGVEGANPGFRNSAPCMKDINCFWEDKDVMFYKYATCLIASEEYCTGTIINTTAKDQKPYILTAAHCIDSEAAARKAVIHFNYETAICDGLDSTSQSISGSKIVAKGEHLDFALLELREKIPISYQPLYLGWDVSGSRPPNTRTIHHPWGDVKKYNFTNSSPGNGSVTSLENLDLDANTHWLIPDYDEGSTQEGSSGSALLDQGFNAIGVLSSGNSVCSGNIRDHYQKLSHCWNDYPEQDQQLKAWLDSENTGKTSMSYIFPGDLSVGEWLSNIDTTVDSTGLMFAKNDSLEGYVSGHNKRQQKVYAEAFKVKGTKYIEAIRLLPGVVKWDTSVKYTDETMPYIDIILWSGDSSPEEELYRKRIYYFELFQGDTNSFFIQNTIKINHSFFAGYEIYYPGDEIFAVNHVVNRGTNSNDKKNTAFALSNGK